jgi:hypothetical protein
MIALQMKVQQENHWKMFDGRLILRRSLLIRAYIYRMELNLAREMRRMSTPSQKDISDLLFRISGLLSSKAASKHRIRSYRNGAEKIIQAELSIAETDQAKGGGRFNGNSRHRWKRLPSLSLHMSQWGDHLCMTDSNPRSPPKECSNR